MPDSIRRLSILLIALAVVAACGGAPEVDWPQFRGPGGVGLIDATDLPERWSASSENVRWRTELPGQGNSSPIVAGGRVFVTTATAGADSVERSVVAIDAASGEILWQTPVGDEPTASTPTPRPRR